jgi:hypothetical protein
MNAMTTPYPTPDYDNDSPDHGREAITTEYKFSHVTTGRYLPTPGKAPAWPFADIGSWMIDANASAGDWLTELKDWRREHLVRIGYTDVNYRRPELQWAQRNFVHAQMMVEDRYFFDVETAQYTVDKYLDDLVARFGGLDSVLIWYIYPNIGIDDRNQFDLAHTLPGGLEGLTAAVKAFQKRGVRVFLPAKPWDHGTRDPGVTHWDGMAEIIKATGADGINGDTFNGVPRAFFDACDANGNPVVVQPESTISSEEQLIWNVQSWGKKAPDGPVPPVSKWKWLEPRHMVNYENRWGRNRNHDLQYCFFNGIGYNAWENIWGIWNQFTARDGETLRRDLPPVPAAGGIDGLGAVPGLLPGRHLRQQVPGRWAEPAYLHQPQRIRGQRRADRPAARGRHALLRRVARRGTVAVDPRWRGGDRTADGSTRLRRGAERAAGRGAEGLRRLHDRRRHACRAAAQQPLRCMEGAGPAAARDPVHPAAGQCTGRHGHRPRR